MLGSLLGAAAGLLLPTPAPGAPGAANGPLTAEEADLLCRLQELNGILANKAHEAWDPRSRELEVILRDLAAKTEARLERYGVAGGARG